MLSSCREDFVEVKGTQFQIQGSPYYFLGTNFWYGMNLGSSGAGGDRARLIRELDRLSALGVTNLRVMAASEGPDDAPYRMSPSLQPSPGKYNEQILEGLDFLLAEMRVRNMRAVMCLNNFWNWSGGMSQYLVWSDPKRSIPHPPPHPGGDWQTYQEFTAQFYDDQVAMELFNNYLRFITKRINSITKLPYAADPTIMAWELANEPRGVNRKESYLKWIDQTSRLIKTLAPKQLITIGSEGETASIHAGTDPYIDHKFDSIDYVTFHLWVQNWGIYDPANPEITLAESVEYAKSYIKRHEQAAKRLNKPLVLEEFGISRDRNDHSSLSSTQVRDEYYRRIFLKIYGRSKIEKSVIAGVNFWAWGGEGRPRSPEVLWEVGDDFIGDPAHETQGWYSVYDTDKSTLKIIKRYSEKMNKL